MCWSLVHYFQTFDVTKRAFPKLTHPVRYHHINHHFSWRLLRTWKKTKKTYVKVTIKEFENKERNRENSRSKECIKCYSNNCSKYIVKMILLKVTK